MVLNHLSRFLSTLSLRRATALIRYLINTYHNFYPRSPCGERQRLGLLGWLRTLISIHALLAESDEHAYQLVLWVLRFLSTLSLRRATLNLPSRPIDKNISIHALLAESDGAS